MTKKCLFFGAILFCASLFSQTSKFAKVTDSLKNKDNLAEFIYIHLDEFAKNPTVENLPIFEQLSTKLWRTAKTEKEKISQLYFYINYAYYLKELGFINQSIIYYEKSFDFYKKQHIKNYDIIEFCLKPLANNYTRIGDVDSAEDVLKVTIEKAQEESKGHQIIATYLNLAAVLRIKGAYDSAIDYLNLGLKISSNNLEKSRLYSDLAINFLMKDAFEQAKNSTQISNSFNTSKDVAILAKNANTLGSVFFKKNELDNALIQFNIALQNAQIVYGKNDREVAKIYNQIAQVYGTKKDYKKAQEIYQKALTVLLPKYSPKAIIENPISEYFYPENTLKDSFDGRANLFIEIGSYQEALKNYELAFLVEDELRLVYTNQNAKLLQQQENRNRSEKCIELCYFLFEQTKNTNWVEKAFLYAEKTKATVLVEAKNLLTKKSNIGKDSLFEKENLLLFKRAQLNKNITIEQLKETKADIDILAKLTEERNEVSTDLQLLNQEILKKYPHFKSLNSKITSVNDIQQKVLLKNDLLVEFFDGNFNMYIFSIEKDRPISIIKIEKTVSFTQEINLFLNFFSDGRGNTIQNNIKDYTTLGFKLYQKLFHNLANKNTIIIPDGIISFIPFDALITEKTSSTNFEKLPYFLQKSCITYAYSSTMLLNEKSTNNLKSEVLGFFPVFENNHRGLSQLTYTLIESSSIKQQLNGNFLVGSNATKRNFEKLAENYPIIHLSTHATAGDYFEPPAIEFYDETLYLPEIYGYSLNSDLLVLSACETGLGTLRKGEGAMSLARGFSYAGVKNLIVSLWKVNDKATEILMADFYKQYRKINNKGEALHLSKLNYLNDDSIASNKKSPYYWASFVSIGEVNSNYNPVYSYWWIIGFGFILIIAYFLFKKP
ncbi:CHAT domain-containing protein [Lutibacter sp.]|uniref:CHAT domain-containing protein n=1 Tax=Lutibacter sp. TaxID=1925666 RepID=UPI001A2FB16E|nr:CHAT domain-containing tetratricopeptide repeat protein [Lutibacter sp.]MBI9040283.1 CHAT domain-containing protein [Lutibacter sp.]